MRFFALETDVHKIVRRFCGSPHEQQVIFTRYHGLSFLFSSLREILVSIVFFAVGIGLVYWGAPLLWTALGLFFFWVFFAFINIIKAWIDWRYDFICVTTDKILIVDQTSIIKQDIKPIHIENVGSVKATTQFWDLFGFGIVVLSLKEGEGGEDIVLRYVPNNRQVAAQISDIVARYQRKPHTSFR